MPQAPKTKRNNSHDKKEKRGHAGLELQRAEMDDPIVRNNYTINDDWNDINEQNELMLQGRVNPSRAMVLM